MLSEEFVKRIIIGLPSTDGIALDLGAFVGDYTDMLSEKFEKVYAFEPHPLNINTLKYRFNHNSKVEIVPYAVSDKIGTAKLYDNKIQSEHSLSRMFAQLGAWGYNPDKYIEVKTITLDEFCKHINVDFMKVDIEGAEHFMFKGAVETLQRCNPMILMECHLVVDFEALTELFKGLGYKFMSTDLEEVPELLPGNHFLIHKNSVTVER
jgi:FkbM family methyltransferase